MRSRSAMVKISSLISRIKNDGTELTLELIEMSMDKSLKKAGGLSRQRNVLTRAERLALLQEDGKWKPEDGVYNVPKTKSRRLAPGQSGPKRPAEK